MHQPSISQHDISKNGHANGHSILKTSTTRKKIGLFAHPLPEDVALFELESSFVARFAGQQPAWGPLGFVTYKRTYARMLADGSTEEYWQTCKRVVEGVYRIQQRHCALYNLPWFEVKAQRSAQRMFELMWDFKFLPPGRGLWMMGTEFIEYAGGAALNNCSFVSTEQIATNFSSPFTFLMDMSMVGVGVGGDVRGAGQVTIMKPSRASGRFVIPDTREGWVEALRIALEAYVGRGSIPFWDYSEIRPAGRLIKGFGGVSAGPAPLQQLLETDVPLTLDPLVGKPISEAAIVDLFNFIGKCVVSGNVRRSAEIMFGTSDEFMSLKDPDQHAAALEDRRWASNNSIFATVGQSYSRSAKKTAKNGEPGYEWLDNARAYGRMVDLPNNADHKARGTNPCNEQTLESFELCCLVETFPARHSSYKEYQETLKYAYLYAKTVTLVPIHDQRANAVMMRNRRIGTSQSGIVQSFQKLGRRKHFEWCDKGYKFLKALDSTYSDWLCVPKSIKITSVKPSGTVSLLPGATPGIHYPHSEYYIRRIRMADNSPLTRALIRAGYFTEPCVYTPNTTVVEFPVHEGHFLKGEDDVSLWEQVGNAIGMQRYWADNQVSCTVKFDQQSEGHQIEDVLELFEDQLKGISFLPRAHGYKQAPYEKISQEEYERRTSCLKPLDLSAVGNEEVERFCDGDTCTIVR